MDRELVERARSGDHEAFAALVRASVDRAYAVAALVLHDRDRAEDAVQDALVAAWRGIRALREPGAWDAWLQRLVVRSSYRLARREGQARVTWVDPGSADPGREDGAGALADRDQIDRGLSRLPAEQRAILVLHYYLGLPLTEVAAVLGIPAGTVKSRLHRAIAGMRADLDADARRHVLVGELS